MSGVLNFNQNPSEGGCGCSSTQQGGRRKLTAYNLFVRKESKVLKAQYPAKKAPEILKLVAKKWKEQKGTPVKTAKKATKVTKKTQRPRSK